MKLAMGHVSPADNSHGIYDLRPHSPRVTFGMLLEAGLLQPGQILYYKDDLDRAAIVLPNGHLRYGELSGSIHQVARQIAGAPCNGWDYWYYHDEDSGERCVIDYLRQLVRDS